MASFAIYNYSFHGITKVGLFLGQEDETKPLFTAKERQDFVQKIFHDDLNGGRQFECGRMEEQKTPDGKRIRTKMKYGCQVVWENYGLIFLKVSNPYKSITKHSNFQKIKEKDEPWCHVLIDNRPDREFIAIEKNSAFNSPDSVAAILESSIRARLAPHRVDIEIKNSYEPDAFWETVDRYKAWGIYEVAFKFAAPNPAWQAELIGSVSEAAKAMNARPTTVFTSPDGAPILLSKDNEELFKYVEACGLSGEDIIIKVKGIRTRIHIKDVKDKFVFKQMSEETYRLMLSGEPDLFNEDFGLIASFLDQVKATKKKDSEDV